MIAHVWPGAPDAVLQADWRELGLGSASIDVALCDGGLHLLDYPAAQAALLRHLADLLAPDGLLAMRLFLPPATPETPEAVLAALLARRIRDLNCLKLRLGMALQRSPQAGVALHEVWSTLRQAGGDWDSLARRLGWAQEHLEVIDAYRDSAATYHFVTEAEVSALAADNGFELLWTGRPAYEMGAQCPTAVFRRRARPDDQTP
jgi:SAM-dependent methyltransferase